MAERLKVVACQTKPEFDSQNSHGGSRGLSLQVPLATYTLVGEGGTRGREEGVVVLPGGKASPSEVQVHCYRILFLPFGRNIKDLTEPVKWLSR